VSEVWLLITVLALGLLQFLDTGLYSYVAYNLNVGGIYLGVMSALWSLIYILANHMLSGLADLGRNKLLIIISTISLLAIYVLFININEVNSLLMYSLHALAIASVNLALSITVLEIYDYFSWGRVNMLSRVLSNVFRGVTFLLVALGGINLSIIIVSLIITSITSVLLIPSIGLNIERKLYKMSRDLSLISRYMKASTALLYIHRPKEALEIFERVWSGSDRLRPWKILISAFSYVAFSDAIFVILPLILKNSLSLNTLMFSWGIALLVTGVTSIPVISIIGSLEGGTSMKLVITSILLRGLTLVLLLQLVSDTLTLTLYLLTVVFIGTLADSLMYNKFVEVNAGYSTSNYFIARELGSIVGSLISGFVFVLVPTAIPVISLVFVGISIIFLII